MVHSVFFNFFFSPHLIPGHRNDAYVQLFFLLYLEKEMYLFIFTLHTMRSSRCSAVLTMMGKLVRRKDCEKTWFSVPLNIISLFPCMCPLLVHALKFPKNPEYRDYRA